MSADFRISGRADFSSAVKWPRTKLMSPSLARTEGLFVPRRRRGKSSVLRWEETDLRPLFPPLEPLARKRVSPKGRSKSSQMTVIFSGEIL